ncbi:hypothetical protein AAZX31_04G193000 [Glycine max]
MSIILSSRVVSFPELPYHMGIQNKGVFSLAKFI